MSSSIQNTKKDLHQPLDKDSDFSKEAKPVGRSDKAQAVKVETTSLEAFEKKSENLKGLVSEAVSKSLVSLPRQGYEKFVQKAQALVLELNQLRSQTGDRHALVKLNPTYLKKLEELESCIVGIELLRNQFNLNVPVSRLEYLRLQGDLNRLKETPGYQESYQETNLWYNRLIDEAEAMIGSLSPQELDRYQKWPLKLLDKNLGERRWEESVTQVQHEYRQSKEYRNEKRRQKDQRSLGIVLEALPAEAAAVKLTSMVGGFWGARRAIAKGHTTYLKIFQGAVAGMVVAESLEFGAREYFSCSARIQKMVELRQDFQERLWGSLTELANSTSKILMYGAIGHLVTRFNLSGPLAAWGLKTFNDAFTEAKDKTLNDYAVSGEFRADFSEFEAEKFGKRLWNNLDDVALMAVVGLLAGGSRIKTKPAAASEGTLVPVNTGVNLPARIQQAGSNALVKLEGLGKDLMGMGVSGIESNALELAQSAEITTTNESETKVEETSENESVEPGCESPESLEQLTLANARKCYEGNEIEKFYPDFIPSLRKSFRNVAEQLVGHRQARMMEYAYVVRARFNSVDPSLSRSSSEYKQHSTDCMQKLDVTEEYISVVGWMRQQMRNFKVSRVNSSILTEAEKEDRLASIRQKISEFEEKLDQRLSLIQQEGFSYAEFDDLTREYEYFQNSINHHEVLILEGNQLLSPLRHKSLPYSFPDVLFYPSFDETGELGVKMEDIEPFEDHWGIGWHPLGLASANAEPIGYDGQPVENNYAASTFGGVWSSHDRDHTMDWIYNVSELRREFDTYQSAGETRRELQTLFSKIDPEHFELSLRTLIAEKRLEAKARLKNESAIVKKVYDIAFFNFSHEEGHILKSGGIRKFKELKETLEFIIREGEVWYEFPRTDYPNLEQRLSHEGRSMNYWVRLFTNENYGYDKFFESEGGYQAISNQDLLRALEIIDEVYEINAPSQIANSNKALLPALTNEEA